MTTIARYTKKFAHYLRNNRAVSAMEYAILVGIIAVAIATAITNFGTSISTGMGKIGTAITGTKVSTPDADNK